MKEATDTRPQELGRAAEDRMSWTSHQALIGWPGVSQLNGTQRQQLQFYSPVLATPLRVTPVLVTLFCAPVLVPPACVTPALGTPVLGSPGLLFWPHLRLLPRVRYAIAPSALPFRKSVHRGPSLGTEPVEVRARALAPHN